jgi:calcineurin-like phosphoesterase family protein
VAGDIALGPIEKSLPLVARLNGYKIAVMGNHDRPFMRAGKADENDWVERYEDVFQEVWHWNGLGLAMPEIGNIYVSHFPYTGDHTPTDRHADARPVDNGDPLVHGHTHSTDRLTFSSKGTPQVHVGQDAWDFRPVSEHEVARLIKGV